MTAITVNIHPHDLDHVRTMLREQISGDRELLRDIDADREAETLAPDAVNRLMTAESIAAQIGGLYGDGFASECCGS